MVQLFWLFGLVLDYLNFNTSYVVVQLNCILLYCFKCLISIHLMLWFNKKAFKKQCKNLIFQYILCCGSTCFICVVFKTLFHFNTSYVVVQLLQTGKFWRGFFNFNTSYVVVQLLLHKICLRCFIISIHLMLWFNHCWYVIAIFYYTEVLLK